MASALLQRVASGEAAAFAQCMDLYGDLVWSLARRFSPNHADAEDSTQEIFLRLWKAAAQYDPARGSEAVFIATLARRLLIDRYRERRRRPVEVSDQQEEPVWATHEDHSVSVDAARAAAALQQLRPEQQRVIALSVAKGLSQGEIASATGMPLGTVKTLMRRAFLELRERLGGGFTP
jgi:RNA polymerase sigma-70 factor (ECF subfamily)